MTITPSNTRIARAQMYFRESLESVNCRRKYSLLPYSVHTEAVAKIVSDVGGDEDEIIIALGHDELEEVTYKNPSRSIERIVTEFGEDVAMGIFDLTDQFIPINYPGWNRVKRKRAEAERLGKVHNSSKLVKLADLLDNSKDIMKNDKDFAKTYLREKEYLLPFLSVPGDPRNVELMARCQAVLAR